MHNLHEPNIITLVWPLLKLEYPQEWEHTVKLTIVALQTTWRSTAESSDPSEGLQLDWSCSLDYCGSVYSVVTVLPCRLQFRSVLVTSHAENIHIHRKHSVNITFIIVLFLLSISFCLCPLLIKGKKKNNTNISHYKTTAIDKENKPNLKGHTSSEKLILTICFSFQLVIFFIYLQAAYL